MMPLWSDLYGTFADVGTGFAIEIRLLLVFACEQVVLGDPLNDKTTLGTLSAYAMI